MSLPQLTFRDVERAAVEVVSDLLVPHEPGVPVRVGVDSDWEPQDGPAVSVAWDGSPGGHHPVMMDATIRVAVRSSVPSESKRLALLIRGLFLGHSGGVLSPVRPGVGVQPESESRTGQEIWWFTVIASTRAVPISPAS